MAFYSQFVRYYDSIFPFKQQTFDFLADYTTPTMTSVLDVGCGTGHYAAAFARAGWQTVGIDLDAAMIEYAKIHHTAPEFYAMNMLDIDALNHQFDLIFCIGNTLAHLNKTELVTFLRKVRRQLKPGGLWIFQVLNWDFVLQQTKFEFPVLQAENGRVQFTRSYTDITADSLHFNTRLTDADTEVFQERVTMTPIVARDYRTMHKDLHFKFIEQFADFQRSPFDPDRNSALVSVFSI